MAEPQPLNVHEGASPPDVVPASAEDVKAARALSSLDAGETAAPKKELDVKALNDAMKTLDGDAPVKREEVKKPVKIEAEHVALLVEYLDIAKPKATELLKSHDANVTKAMVAWVTHSNW
ncbi:hypothetical protein K470DRAFT_210915 [Piedraia hortae CBS 480.64]|uniref:Nascent polypeptide-associated complex subunit alpha-like UBA domain-containing protein n=1 Tax=Piedraia hortae CBS 480.64 TaxID=1314780 RepID=A0A6A7C8A6_9PEZI|nr:hypothetical protein K470DRAFT_210915 [Piedraia hortae CBS 480.64]